MAAAGSAKRFTVTLFVLGLAGCAGLERFAPPGIVKYEDLAGDKSQNETIKARVVEVRGARDAEFPNLSNAPQGAPETLSADEQASLETELLAARELLRATVVSDRAGAEADRLATVVLPGVIETPSELQAVRDALNAAVANDDAQARSERKLPARKPAAADAEPQP